MATHCSISAWRILRTEEPGMEEEVTTVYEVTKSQTRLSDKHFSLSINVNRLNMLIKGRGSKILNMLLKTF